MADALRHQVRLRREKQRTKQVLGSDLSRAAGGRAERPALANATLPSPRATNPSNVGRSRRCPGVAFASSYFWFLGGEPTMLDRIDTVHTPPGRKRPKVGRPRSSGDAPRRARALLQRPARPPRPPPCELSGDDHRGDLRSRDHDDDLHPWSRVGSPLQPRRYGRVCRRPALPHATCSPLLDGPSWGCHRRGLPGQSAQPL